VQRQFERAQSLVQVMQKGPCLSFAYAIFRSCSSFGRVQIAFGHHRIEAARQELGEGATVPIIIRDLTDKEMLEFMGRENLEDYNTNFTVMLESWEAARDFLAREPGRKMQTLNITKRFVLLHLSKQLAGADLGPERGRSAPHRSSRPITITCRHARTTRQNGLVPRGRCCFENFRCGGHGGPNYLALRA
jgi:hypothetical protein